MPKRPERFLRFIESILFIILIIAVSSSTIQAPPRALTRAPFHPYDSGIVYILPSQASTPYWQNTYGSRESFWVYANITEYKNAILKDLDAIYRSYRFIILILPLDDTILYYHNLKQLDSWTAEKNLRILYAFFPKSKFGSEWTYLIPKTEAHTKMIYNMQYVQNLTSTKAIAIWYGWKQITANLTLVEGFYNSLPPTLSQVYYVWLDGPYAAEAIEAGLSSLADRLSIGAVTELYSPDYLTRYGFAFKRQIIVTGVPGAATADEWRTQMAIKLTNVQTHSNIDFQPRKLAVWTFWDRNDGSNEAYTAYIAGTLINPLAARPPPAVIVDTASPTRLRVNVDSSPVVSYHLSWDNGLPASSIVVSINGTSYMTNDDGWIIFTATSRKVTKLTWIPTGAKWGPYVLRVESPVGYPTIIFDRVKIELTATSPKVEAGSSAPIITKGYHEYDRTPFRGTVLLNDTILNKTIGIYYYAVKSIEDHAYGLTAFESNTVELTIYEPTKMPSAQPSDTLAPLPLIGIALFTIALSITIRNLRKVFPVPRKQVRSALLHFWQGLGHRATYLALGEP